MKLLALCLLSFIFSTFAIAADNPRLSLWITEPIGSSNAMQCNLSQAGQSTPTLPTIPATVTEHDIASFDIKNGRWALSTEKFSREDAFKNLLNRCFILAVDDKYITSGVILTSYSARLILFPVLKVHRKNDTVTLQLTSDSHTYSKNIHLPILAKALANKSQGQHQAD